MKKVFLGAVLVSVMSVTGCAQINSVFTQSTPAATSTISDAKASIAAETKTATPSPTPVSTRTSVIWVDYDPGTQGEIDLYTRAKDCRGVQSFVGMATATEASVKAKTGHGNDALLKYINESLAIAGCS